MGVYALKPEETTFVNEFIKVKRVMLIGASGEKMGEFLTLDAIKLANDQGLDLVEVASAGDGISICKMINYDKFKYEKKKRQKKNNSGSIATTLKEMYLSPRTEEHDLNVKAKKVKEFLTDGNRVRVCVEFKGRDLAHINVGKEQCIKMFDKVSDISDIEEQPRMFGKHMNMTLAPKKEVTAVKK